ncbi:MAG: energy transducer TonB [Bacteroidota bacterium]
MSLSRNPFFRLSLVLGIVLPATIGGFFLASSGNQLQDYGCTFSETPVVIAYGTEGSKFNLTDTEASINSREIFKIVEQMPIFPGVDCGEIRKYPKRKACSERAMLEYIYSHIRYPKKARDRGAQGMAVVSFVVEKNGVLTNIKVARDPGFGMGEAVAKVVRYMKADNIRFEPGLQKGKPVRVQF